MASRPVEFFAGSMTRMQSMDPDRVQELQLEALRWRFETLREQIPILASLVERRGIHDIPDFDAALPLLFDHTVFKSYPKSLVDDKRFDALTRWLGKLTTHDLSNVDVSGCRGLDDWFHVLDVQTPLSITHSSGTTGSLSLLAWDKAEWDTLGQLHAAHVMQRFGDDADCRRHEGIDVIYPFYRGGALGHLRNNDQIVKHIAKGEERFHAAYPGRLSSDVMYLAGRLRAAQASGRPDSVRIDPELLKRKKEFDDQSARAEEHLSSFFDAIGRDLAGRRILIFSTWNLMHGMAKAGFERGLRAVFTEDSIVIAAGGAKGMVPPSGWKEDVIAFVGNDRVRNAYSMSEVAVAGFGCEFDHYHLNPWVVPYVLDPATSEPLPRRGVQTGRAAYFDLLAQTHWGGFISGDLVTLHWNPDCPCARTTPYLLDGITRLSDQRGDDDKITCAASVDAHTDALAYLNGFDDSESKWP